jgi:hypothetical protein
VFTFKKNYFLLFVLLFIIEVLIALYVKDNFVRPYVGDLLVVILIYCFVRAFFKISIKWAAIAVLLFAYTVEVLQYFKLVKMLGLQKSTLANIVIGNTFQTGDLVAYTAGIGIVLLVENRLSTNHGFNS